MILAHLKSYSAGFHEALELKVSRVLFSPTLRPEEYQTTLCNFFVAYHYLESCIVSLPEIKPILSERSKLDWLKKDLEAMTNYTGETSVYELLEPRIEENIAAALGMMYVMEGATLGGKFIVNHLKKHEWIASNDCLNFFNSYGERRSDMWKKFTVIVEEFSEQYPDQEKFILQGARSTFSFMNDIFDEKIIDAKA